MSLSKLSEKCKNCPFVDKCKNKRMEALAYIPELSIAANVGKEGKNWFSELCQVDWRNQPYRDSLKFIEQTLLVKHQF